MLFNWLFRKQLAEIAATTAALKQREVALDAKLAVAKAVTTEIARVHERVVAADALLTKLVPQAAALLDTVTTQITGFNSRYNNLAHETAASTAVLVAKADTAIEDIKNTFGGMIDARVKAEMGKWAFSGGAGGALAVHQYCTRCAVKSARWSMIPDEGPVCAMCLEG